MQCLSCESYHYSVQPKAIRTIARNGDITFYYCTFTDVLTHAKEIRMVQIIFMRTKLNKTLTDIYIMNINLQN